MSEQNDVAPNRAEMTVDEALLQIANMLFAHEEVINEIRGAVVELSNRVARLERLTKYV